MAINELRSITTFIRTAELGSISKAAQAQEISQQAASKALAQLEQHLGLRLFHRTTRSVSLTEEGQRFLEATQPSLIALQRALQFARSTKQDIAGPLRILAPRTVVQSVLGPVLDEYCRLYPEVVPDMQLDDRIGNWVEDRIDVGFRLGNPPQEGVIARPLLPLQLIICAAPSYIRRYGMPSSLDDLSIHRCSAFRRATDSRLAPWRVQVGESTQDHHVRPSFSTNDEVFELRAALAGEIVAQLAGATAAPHIRAGRLVPLLLDCIADDFNLYIYYGSRTGQPARVRSFIDLVVERLHDNPEFIFRKDELMAIQATAIRKIRGDATEVSSD